jgi:hypothetical protein
MAKTKQKRDLTKKRRGPETPPPPVLDLDYTEVEEGAEQPEPTKIELFKYKGTTYYMAEPDATLMLDLIKAAGERGEMGAVWVMLSGLMGEDTYRVLQGIPNLSKQELNGVVSRVMHFSMDVMDEIMGES